MTKGRKPLPDKVKKLRGNPGKRAIKTDAIQSDNGSVFPVQPSWMDAKAKALWKELRPLLEPLDAIQKLDKVSLALLCQTYAEWRDTNQLVEDHGYFQEIFTENGQKKQAQPFVAQRSDAAKRLVSLMAEFGMTPSARAKIKGPEGEKENPLADILNRGRLSSKAS